MEGGNRYGFHIANIIIIILLIIIIYCCWFHPYYRG
jgi:hypothetical protein